MAFRFWFFRRTRDRTKGLGDSKESLNASGPDALGRLEPGSLERRCASCGGTGQCLTCGSTGVWYADTSKEETCASCRGSGQCPACGNDLLA